MALGADVYHALKFVLTARSKALDFYGKVMAFFFICFAMTYVYAFECIVKKDDPKQKIELNIFTYCMPFVSFIMDASVRRAYLIQARSIVMCLKIMVIFFYLSVYVVSLQQRSESKIYWLSVINFFVFPLLMLGYMVALMKRKLS